LLRRDEGDAVVAILDLAKSGTRADIGFIDTAIAAS
jgi:hypothetical protein